MTDTAASPARAQNGPARTVKRDMEWCRLCRDCANAGSVQRTYSVLAYRWARVQHGLLYPAIRTGLQSPANTLRAVCDGVTRLSGGDIIQITHSIFLVVHTLQGMGLTLYASLSSWGYVPYVRDNIQSYIIGGIVPD